MKGMEQLPWVFGVARVARVRSPWLGFADDSLGEKRVWRRDLLRISLPWRGGQKIILIAILLPPLSGTSAVRNQFLEPLSQVYDQATTRRNCPVESDWDWLTKGVDRVLSNVRSGRDFLQAFQLFWRREVQVGPYFETLASARRLGMVAECSALLRRQVDAARPSPLSQFESLASFDLHAGDGHYLAHATHDPMQGETRWPTGHFFALNLKSQSLFPLALADLVGRKKEHDVRALKRQSVARLRQGAGKDRKVMWVWDKAGVDLPFWQERKASGIYFLSLRKEGRCLAVEQERVIDLTQPINQGVTAETPEVIRRGGIDGADFLFFKRTAGNRNFLF